MALYNVERPHDFSHVVGQIPTVKILSRDLLKKNIKHAYLFIGVRGTGKTTIARIFSEAVNCHHPQADGSPCGSCPSCKAIRSGSSVDVYELDAASNNSVDDIRNILEKVSYTPLEKYKVFIIDECHMLSTSASNALLKCLEEPPANVIFILCTTEKHKVLPTIISRCSCHEFEKISSVEIHKHLAEICQKYSVTYENKALAIISKAANGGMRDALSILDKFISSKHITTDEVANALGMTSDEIIFGLLQAIADKQPVLAIDALKFVVKKGGHLAYLVEEVFHVLLDLVEFQSSGNEDCIIGTSDYVNAVIDLSFKMDTEKAFQIMDELRKVYQNKSVEMEFSMTAAIISVIYENTLLAKLKEDVEELKSQVKLLNEKDISVSVEPVSSNPSASSSVSSTNSIPEEPSTGCVAESSDGAPQVPKAENLSAFIYEEEEFSSVCSEETPFSSPCVDEVPGKKTQLDCTEPVISDIDFHPGMSFDELQAQFADAIEEAQEEMIAPNTSISSQTEASDKDENDFMSDALARLFDE